MYVNISDSSSTLSSINNNQTLLFSFYINFILPEADCPNVRCVGHSRGGGGQREKYLWIPDPEGKYVMHSAKLDSINTKCVLFARFGINRVHISGVDFIKDATQKSAHKNEDRWQLVGE